MVANNQESLGALATPQPPSSTNSKGQTRLIVSFVLVCLLGISTVLFLMGMGLGDPGHISLLMSLLLSVVIAPVVAFILLFAKHRQASKVVAAIPAIPMAVAALHGLSLLSDNDQMFGDIVAAFVLTWAGAVVVFYGWFYYEVHRSASKSAPDYR